MRKWKLIQEILKELNFPDDVIEAAKTLDGKLVKSKLGWNTPEFHHYLKYNKKPFNEYSAEDLLRLINSEDYCTACYACKNCYTCPVYDKSAHSCCNEYWRVRDAVLADYLLNR